MNKLSLFKNLVVRENKAFVLDFEMAVRWMEYDLYIFFKNACSCSTSIIIMCNLIFIILLSENLSSSIQPRLIVFAILFLGHTHLIIPDWKVFFLPVTNQKKVYSNIKHDIQQLKQITFGVNNPILCFFT